MFDIILFDIQQINGVTQFNHKPTIGMQLHSLSNINRRYIDNNSHKELFESITGTNGWIIGYLDNNRDKDIFQKDLEDAFSITRSTVSKVVNLMVQKGLIERSPVEYDARLKKLTLTDKSLELISYMENDRLKHEEVLMKGFSDEEKHQLSEYILRMKNNMKTALSELGIEDSCPMPKGGRK